MSGQEMRFEYHPEIAKVFPEARAGVLFGRGVDAQGSPEELQKLFFAEQEKVLAEIGDTPLSELESLAAWRSAFRRFDVNPTKYRSAVEALLRRLTKKGDIPSVNTLVDIGNLVSIRYRLPVAILDTARLDGQVCVQFSNGDEEFIPLFSDQAEHPVKGEVIFRDSSGVVAARRWCWRQSDESAARNGTKDFMVITEGLHAAAENDIQAALADLTGLFSQFVGGEYGSGIIRPGELSFIG